MGPFLMARGHSDDWIGSGIHFFIFRSTYIKSMALQRGRRILSAYKKPFKQEVTCSFEEDNANPLP